MTEQEINRNKSFYLQIAKFALRKSTIYKIFKTYGPLTDFELSKKMVLPINSINGRRNELQHSCFIKPVWSKLNEVTGVTNTVWMVTSPEERTILITSKLLKLKDEQDILQCDINSIYISKITRELIIKRIIKVEKLINTLE